MSGWVDFRMLKQSIHIEQVLESYGFALQQCCAAPPEAGVERPEPVTTTNWLPKAVRGLAHFKPFKARPAALGTMCQEPTQPAQWMTPLALGKVSLSVVEARSGRQPDQLLSEEMESLLFQARIAPGA
jgi:hypothetical protein